MDLPVILRDEVLDAVLTLDQDRQRRRLHAANGGEVEAAGLRVEGGHRARAVDANQPVGFRPAHRRVGQRAHGGVVAQLLKTLADGRGGHGLQPKAFDGPLRLRVLDDVAKDQLALAAGVASVDQRVHVRALDQLEQQPQPRRILVNGQQVEVRRNDRQVGKAPLAALDLELLRHAQLQQMTDG